jgi:molybdate transport system substrate-binding protein
MRQLVLVALAACLLVPAPAVYAQAPPPAGPALAGAPADSPGRAGTPVLGDKVADANPGDVRVIATGSILASLQSVRDEADRAVGKHLVIEYGTARGSLRDQIINGQAFELAILVPDVNDELVQKGLARTPRYEIARIPVGIGYTGDGPLPDISTPAALKKTLLGAKQVMYAQQGMGAQSATKMIDALGIKDSIKVVFPGAGGPGAGLTPVVLAPGEYTISIQPTSEIFANKNAKYAGPVIDAYQVPQILEAVVGAHARDEKSAKSFVDYLRGPEFGAVLKRNGFVQSR